MELVLSKGFGLVNMAVPLKVGLLPFVTKTWQCWTNLKDEGGTYGLEVGNNFNITNHNDTGKQDNFNIIFRATHLAIKLTTHPTAMDSTSSWDESMSYYSSSSGCLAGKS